MTIVDRKEAPLGMNLLLRFNLKEVQKHITFTGIPPEDDKLYNITLEVNWTIVSKALRYHVFAENM